MRLLVTAGGTREPIDAVRVIANSSTGRLGARLVDEALAAGHEVLLLHAAQAALPERACRRQVFETHADLARLLEQHGPWADAIFHAAAVADYVPVAAAGKLPSDRPELVLRLQRAPKLIDGLRALNARAWLVGFKLTAGLGADEQVSAAQALRARARLDLVVVNDAARTGEADHEALLVEAGGVVARCRGKAELARQLVARLPASPGGPAIDDLGQQGSGAGMKVLIGVCGGIAAYKTCEVVRRLRDGSHEVQVVMTEAAAQFVTPMTFEVLSGRPVATSLFATGDPSIEHIRLARWPDVIAIVPATANSIGRIANGLADDLLSTVIMASRAGVPVVIAPAMNTAMWENPLVQRNLTALEQIDGGRRYRFVQPAEKTLACGEAGVGALAEEARIVAAIVEAGRTD